MNVNYKYPILLTIPFISYALFFFFNQTIFDYIGLFVLLLWTLFVSFQTWDENKKIVVVICVLLFLNILPIPRAGDQNSGNVYAQFSSLGFGWPAAYFKRYQRAFNTAQPIVSTQCFSYRCFHMRARIHESKAMTSTHFSLLSILFDLITFLVFFIHLQSSFSLEQTKKFRRK